MVVGMTIKSRVAEAKTKLHLIPANLAFMVVAKVLGMKVEVIVTEMQITRQITMTTTMIPVIFLILTQHRMVHPLCQIGILLRSQIF